MKKVCLKVALSVATVVLLAGCGGDGATTSGSVGYFVDSAVSGVEYSSTTHSGTTSVSGAFSYESGATITFKVGGVTLGSVSSVSIPSSGKVMPQTIAGVALSQKSSTSTAIARFLQSLDEDGDPSNGITISSNVKSALSSAQTLTSSNLSSLVSKAGKSLVSESSALAHLAQTTSDVTGTTISSFSTYVASSSSSSSSTSGTSSSPSTPTTVGTVAGSFYEGATVCFDVNGNGTCDSGEPSTTSNASGDFTLTGSADYDVIAIIPAGAKKHDVVGDAGTAITDSTKTFFAIPKSVIADAQQDAGKIVMSAISTKMYTYAKENPGATTKDIKTAVADALGVSKDDLLKDFNSPKLSASLRTTLKAKSEKLYKVMKGKVTLAAVKTATDDVVGAMTLPSNIDVISAK